LLIASAVFFSWEIAVGIFILRSIIQGVIWYNAMKKLNEQDLGKWYWAFDILMFLYYLIFAPALWKKPKKDWK